MVLFSMKKDSFDGFKFNDFLRGITDLVELVQKMDKEKKTEESKTGNFQFPRDKNLFQGSYNFNVKLGGLPEISRPRSQTVDVRPPAREKKMPADAWEPVMDIFDEGSTVQIVIEVQGVSEDQVNIDVTPGSLDITLQGQAGASRSIPLPCPVNPESLRYSVRNGLLKISLDKAA